MLLRRQPIPILRPFVKALWASQPSDRVSGDSRYRERVLPTGDMHLVFRSGGLPLRILAAPGDQRGQTFERALVGGARADFYLRDVSPAGASVGAQLLPGACLPLFDAPANELAARHMALDDLWGTDAALAYDQIFSTSDPRRQLDVFETILAARLPHVRSVHPAVAQVLAGFDDSPNVDAMVAASGYSHRHFIALFECETGLAPKRFCRVQRFRKLLAEAATRPALSWTELALAAGYSDQSHFNREFRVFTGITPGEYRRAAPHHPHHVPMPAWTASARVNFVQA
ncbi:MAG: helix-turn-helix domain-containing protein [Rhodanobacteraceae bacterium]